jgi:transposase
MPAALKLKLTEEQRKQLERWIKNPPKPHLRRRAWAMLLLAQGKAAYEAARDPRVHAHRTTVSFWHTRYVDEGIQGLKQKPGQGRKPAFSPSAQGGGESTA